MTKLGMAESAGPISQDSLAGAGAKGDKSGRHFTTEEARHAAGEATAHAEGDQWVMPLSEAVAEHKELVETLETPGKADDMEAAKEQGEELARMEAASPERAAETSEIEHDGGDAAREPKDGDTKTENGIEYRLQDGRWHRVTPEDAGQGEPDHNIIEHVTAKGKTLNVHLGPAAIVVVESVAKELVPDKAVKMLAFRTESMNEALWAMA